VAVVLIQSKTLFMNKLFVEHSNTGMRRIQETLVKVPCDHVGWRFVLDQDI